MNQEVLRNFDMPWIPVIGLVLFVVCFIGFTFFTYRRSSKSFYEESSLIPLKDLEMAKKGNSYEFK